jgi:apolipoprotein N-acyltransferase
MVVIVGKRPRHGFILSYICGITFFSGNLLWLFEISRYKLLHHVFLVSYFGLYFGAFGLVTTILSRRLGAAVAFLLAPFVWVSLEYVKSNLGFMAFPWPLLAHSQNQIPGIIQMASVTGSYGVSWLIFLVNSSLSAALLVLSQHRKWLSSSTQTAVSRHSMVCIGTACAVIVLSALVYSRTVISKPIRGKELKVSVIQGNIEQSKKWNPRHAEYIMQTYARLTMEATKESPDLIVWPEGATPRSISLNKMVYARVKGIQNRAGTHLLVGSSSHQKFQTRRGRKVRFHNSAFLLGPDSEGEMQRYDKIRLLPFGEYLPLKDSIPWSWIRVPKLANYEAGSEHTVFQFDGSPFGVNVCWEMGFPELVRNMVKNGAEFMVNLTNMAWFGKTAAPYHMLSVSIFRAVENRLFMVRCANTGVSCIIDPYGRIVGRVRDANGEDIFVRGALTGTVVPMRSRTLYTQYGDWFVWVSFFLSIVFLATGLAKALRRSGGAVPARSK